MKNGIKAQKGSITMKKVSMVKKKRIALLTNNLICNLNSKYFGTLERYFEVNGWEVRRDFNVNKVVISTCGVTNNMFDAAKKAVEDLRTIGFPEEDIIIMGCQTKTHEGVWKEEFSGHLVGLGKEEELDGMIGATVPFKEIEELFVFDSTGELEKGDKSKKFAIQISSGCLQQCTFCAIKQARGFIKSKPLEVIEAQFRLAVQSGYKNISILGSDTFAYGFDTKKMNIIELLNHLLSIDDSVNFFFGNLHIRWLKDYADGIIDLCNRGAITFVNIGLQHINDDVLHSMGRPSFKPDYEIIQRIRKECPNLTIACEIMVGFHGETEEQFEELVEFFRNDKCFNIVTHFIYSDVKSVAAYKFQNKISEEEKAKRWKRLVEVLGDRYPHRAYKKEMEEDLKGSQNAYKKQIESSYYFLKNTYELVGGEC